MSGAQGSLWWLDTEGQLIDHLDHGTPLTGVAWAATREGPLLLLATAQEVTAWFVSPANQ